MVLLLFDGLTKKGNRRLVDGVGASLGHLIRLSTWTQNKDVRPEVPTSSREIPPPPPATAPDLTFLLVLCLTDTRMVKITISHTKPFGLHTYQHYPDPAALVSATPIAFPSDARHLCWLATSYLLSAREGHLLRGFCDCQLPFVLHPSTLIFFFPECHAPLKH